MRAKRLFALLTVLILSGCVTKLEEGHVKFGVTPIFSVRKDVTGLTVNSQRNAAVADTSTRINILNFEWESSAKGAVIRLPKEDNK